MALLPPNARTLVQAGTGDGALARHYRQVYAGCFYQGVEADAVRAAQARQYCQIVHQADIDHAGAAFFSHLEMADGWIFDQTLETLRDPGRVLKAIRQHCAPDACLVAQVANGQHWAMQAHLNSGAWRYADDGQLARRQLHWFSRASLLALLKAAGWRLSAGTPVAGAAPADARIEAAVRAMAQAGGADPQQAWQDALAGHYLIKAVPA